MTNRVLVTGADGFIGSHLVEHLIRSGREVRAFVYYNSFDSWGWLDELEPEVKQQIDVISGDVRDFGSVRAAMKGCSQVMHLAALIGIPYSYIAPESYVDVNIKGTLNVVQAARDLEVSKVVHISTSETYGTARFVPITEEHPLQGQSPYAASKIGADHLALSFYLSFGVPVAIARPFNTYGPRQSTRAVIPTIITQIGAKQQRIELGALSPTRDFNFVTDTVGGMVAVLENDSAVGEIINIGTGFEISVGDLAALIAEVMGADVEIHSTAERTRPPASEVERLLSDNSKAQRLLGWRPDYAGREGLKRGLERTVDWFSDPRNARRYHVGRYSV